MKLIEEIARQCEWHKTVNELHKKVCEENIAKCEEQLPHGSGFDNGCKIDVEQSGRTKVVINFDFHHMNEMGGYCGWTKHHAIITPEFGGFDVKITGPDKGCYKDYLFDVFYDALEREVE